MQQVPPIATFFIDRSLGKIHVPRTLRSAGWSIVVHDEHFGPRAERVPDTEWLAVAGANGWAVLMKDKKIRTRPAERQALINSGVHAFLLTSGSQPGEKNAQLIIDATDRISEIVTTTGPSLHGLSQSGLTKLI